MLQISDYANQKCDNLLRSTQSHNDYQDIDADSPVNTAQQQDKQKLRYESSNDCHTIAASLMSRCKQHILNLQTENQQLSTQMLQKQSHHTGLIPGHSFQQSTSEKTSNVYRYPSTLQDIILISHKYQNEKLAEISQPNNSHTQTEDQNLIQDVDKCKELNNQIIMLQNQLLSNQKLNEQQLSDTHQIYKQTEQGIQQQIVKHENLIKQISGENSQLKSELEQAQSTQRSLESQKNVLLQQNISHFEELEKLKRDNSDSARQIEGYKAQISMLQNQLEKQANRCQDCQCKNTNPQSQCNKQQRQINSASSIKNISKSISNLIVSEQSANDSCDLLVSNGDLNNQLTALQHDTVSGRVSTLKHKFKYYENQIQNTDALHIILDAARNLKQNIEIPTSIKLTQFELRRIRKVIEMEYPELWFVDGARLKVQCDSDYVVNVEVTTLQRDKILSQQRRIYSSLHSYAAKLNDTQSQFYAEQVIFQEIVSKIAYLKNEKNDAVQNPNVYNIIGFFVDEKCCCSGIACGFKYLCDLFGLQTIYVSGSAIRDSNEDDNSGHAWNMIRLGNEWYYLDITWDLKFKINHGKLEQGSCLHQYLNISDKQCFVDHKPDPGYWLPQCSSCKLNYYEFNEQIVKSDNNLFMCDYYQNLKQYLSNIMCRIAQQDDAFTETHVVKLDARISASLLFENYQQFIDLAASNLFGTELCMQNITITNSNIIQFKLCKRQTIVCNIMQQNYHQFPNDMISSFVSVLCNYAQQQISKAVTPTQYFKISLDHFNGLISMDRFLQLYRQKICSLCSIKLGHEMMLENVSILSVKNEQITVQTSISFQIKLNTQIKVLSVRDNDDNNKLVEILSKVINDNIISDDQQLYQIHFDEEVDLYSFINRNRTDIHKNISIIQKCQTQLTNVSTSRYYVQYKVERNRNIIVRNVESPTQWQSIYNIIDAVTYQLSQLLIQSSKQYTQHIQFIVFFDSHIEIKEFIEKQRPDVEAIASISNQFETAMDNVSYSAERNSLQFNIVLNKYVKVDTQISNLKTINSNTLCILKLSKQQYNEIKMPNRNCKVCQCGNYYTFRFE